MYADAHDPERGSKMNVKRCGECGKFCTDECEFREAVDTSTKNCMCWVPFDFGMNKPVEEVDEREDFCAACLMHYEDDLK